MTDPYDEDGWLPCKDDPECPCTHRKCDFCDLPDHPFIGCGVAKDIRDRVEAQRK